MSVEGECGPESLALKKISLLKVGCYPHTREQLKTGDIIKNLMCVMLELHSKNLSNTRAKITTTFLGVLAYLGGGHCAMAPLRP